MRRPLVGLLSTLALFAQNSTYTVSEYPSPLVREEQRRMTGVVTETWRLQWKTTPKPECGPGDVSLTCPCTGFAFGEGGDLDLIRLRGDTEMDRLNLTRYFGDQFTEAIAQATIQRWKPDYDKDFNASLAADFTAQAGHRPVVQVMHFADYDHDGKNEEFFLQTNTKPCGKRFGLVFGLSKFNRQLHAFGTARRPNVPLEMEFGSWEALRKASGPIQWTEWNCEDHGSETQTTLNLSWTGAGISATRLAFACDKQGHPGRLLSQEEL